MAECCVVRFDDFYCKTTFLDADLIFTILSGNRGFSGILDQTKMDTIKEKMAGKFQNIAQMAKQAFTETSEHYDIRVEDEELIWRKVGGKIQLRLASIKLTPINFNDAQAEIIDFLLGSGAKNKSKMAEMNHDLEKKTADLDKSLKMNKELAVAQEESRESMLKQFVQILNTKKLRIRELESELNQIHQRFGPEAFEGSDKESDYGAATDDDEENDDFKDESNESKNVGGLKRKLENTLDNGEKCKSSKINNSLEEDLFEDI